MFYFLNLLWPKSKSFFKILIERMKLSSLIVLASGALGAPAPEVQNKSPVVIQGKNFEYLSWMDADISLDARFETDPEKTPLV